MNRHIDPLTATRDEYSAAGLSEVRFVWDLFHASKYPSRDLYRYLNDSHIETALLRIVRGEVNAALAKVTS